ncbi:RING finger domain-containing protein [Endozoicomonas sp. 4G]|uniref:RING finger domain-containing protein n=1 Tax=Endozoicomonas sp. 4G TaxID=2872754 RepID=UPI002078DF1E|nr:RING finger domain-containing protein [Endozoicomonas sp. 4G]
MAFLYFSKTNIQHGLFWYFLANKKGMVDIFALSLLAMMLAMMIVPLCYSSTLIDRHHPDGRKFRIEINDEKTRNSTLTLTGGKPAANADYPGVGNGGFFYSPPPPGGGGGGRPSGLFEIDLTILQPVISWLMSIGKGSVSFEEQQSPARLQITRVNADGSASEAAIPLDWLNLLDSEQLSDVDFWDTLLQRAAKTCPASDSLEWQLSCLKLFLERTVLKTHHGDGRQAANEDGQPSGSRPNAGSNDANNHQEKREAPEGQENQSPGEGNSSSGDGNNRKDDNGRQSKNKVWTQNLQLLANQLLAIIESDDRYAAFKFREMLDKLEVKQRVQVLKTKGTNISGDTITPLEAILALPRSFDEHSTRNRFIGQLIAAAGNNRQMILSEIVLDIIHKLNQSDQQSQIGHFEKCCFTEYFLQLLLLYPNPVKRIRNLLEKISDFSIRNEIINNAQSLTLPISFLDILKQFNQHSSLHEFIHLSNELRMQNARIAIHSFHDNALSVDKHETKQIDDAECAICRDQFVRTSNIVKTPCNHLFHVDCLNLWLKKRKSDRSIRNCPTCLTNLNSFSRKLNDFTKLLKKYDGCHSLATAKRAVNEWNDAETSYETLYHFVQFCRHSSQSSDDSQFAKLLQRTLHPVMGEGNNRKDDNGSHSKNNASTQDLQLLASQLLAIIENDDPYAAFKFREMLEKLDMPQRLQVLETKSTNINGDAMTPLEAILALPRAFDEHSTRNRFIGQLIEASGNNRQVILSEIVLDIIHKLNQSQQQPQIGHFEKCCFTEYFLQVLLLYPNPVERIRNLLEKISVFSIRNEIINNAQSLTLPTSFLDILKQFYQHSSFHELICLSNGVRIQNNYIAINAFGDNALRVDKEEPTNIIGAECAICQDQFVRTSNIVKTPCKHLYHVHCLHQWLKNKKSDDSIRTCPTCRAELISLREKLNDFNQLLIKYDDCHSLATAERAVNEWNEAETSYETLYHFVQFCRHSSQASDDSQFVKLLRRLIHPVTKAEIYHDALVYSATFSAKNHRVVTASHDGTAKVYVYQSDGTWKGELIVHHDGPVKLASFSADSSRVLTASDDGTAKIHVRKENGSWQEEITIRHRGPIHSATFSTDNSRVLTASNDGTAQIHVQKKDGSWEEEGSINHDDSIRLASFSADGSHVVTASIDNVVKITGKSADGSWQAKIILIHKRKVNSAIFSPDNRYVVTASDDGTANIIAQKDDASWEEAFTISHICPNGGIRSAAFSPDSRHVLTVGDDGLVKIIGKQADGSWLVKAIITHSDRVRSATFSPDSHLVVTSSYDKQAKIYGEKSDTLWEEEITIPHDHRIFSTTFSPDSQHAVTSGDNGTAKIYSHKKDGSWEEVFTIHHFHGRRAISATFSADGRFVMTFGFGGIAIITQLKGDGSWEKAITIRHPNTILSASFSADSRFVLTQSFLPVLDGGGSIVKITELWKEE